MEGLGLRAQYWQFDHTPGVEIGTPPANGFGQIIHPRFGDIDITSGIPGDTFTVASGLNAYTLDLEEIAEVISHLKVCLFAPKLRLRRLVEQTERR